MLNGGGSIRGSRQKTKLFHFLKISSVWISSSKLALFCKSLSLYEKLHLSALYNTNSIVADGAHCIFDTWSCPLTDTEPSIAEERNIHASPLYCVQRKAAATEIFIKIVVISHVDNPKPSIVLMNRNTSMPPITSSMQFYNNRHFQKIVLVSHVVLKLSASMPSIAPMTRNTSTPPIATLRQFCSSRHLPNIVFISHVLTRL